MASNTFQYFLVANEKRVTNYPKNSKASFDISGLYRPNKDSIVTRISLNRAILPRAHYNVAAGLTFTITFCYSVFCTNGITLNGVNFQPGNEDVYNSKITLSLPQGYYTPAAFATAMNNAFQAVFLDAIMDVFGNANKTNQIDAGNNVDNAASKLFLNSLHDSGTESGDLNAYDIEYEQLDVNGEVIANPNFNFFTYDFSSNRIRFNYTWNHMAGLEGFVITKPHYILFEADDGPIRSDVLSLLGLDLNAQQVPFDNYVIPVTPISKTILEMYTLAGVQLARTTASSIDADITQNVYTFSNPKIIVAKLDNSSFDIKSRLIPRAGATDLAANYDNIIRGVDNGNFVMDELIDYSPGLCNGDGITNILIKFNPSLNWNRTSNNQTYFADLPYLHYVGNEVTVFNSNDNSGINLPTGTTINTLEVTLTDQDGKEIDFMGQYWSISLNVTELTNVIPTFNDNPRFGRT